MALSDFTNTWITDLLNPGSMYIMTTGFIAEFENAIIAAIESKTGIPTAWQKQVR